MKKAVAKDYEAYSKKILKICVDKSVSLEAFAYDHSSKKNRALKINNWKKKRFC